MWERFESCSVQHHPSAMYRVMCIYNTELSSVSGASGRTMCGVTTEGAGVGAMSWRGVRSRAFDIIDDAKWHPGFVKKPPVLPVNNDWVVCAIRGGVACIGMMAKGATPKAEHILWVPKGTYWICTSSSIRTGYSSSHWSGPSMNVVVMVSSG